MKRLIAAAMAGALSLGALSGCALTGGLKGLHADAERADTDASLAYVGIASGLNAYEAAPSASVADKASAEALRRKAWEALGAVHAAYAAGQAIDLKPLQDLTRQAAALRSQP